MLRLAAMTLQGVRAVASVGGIRSLQAAARPLPAGRPSALPLGQPWAAEPGRMQLACRTVAAPLPAPLRAFSAEAPAASEVVDVGEVDFDPARANSVSLIGRTGSDIDVRYLENGGRVANFSLAVGGGGMKDSGRQKEASWYTVEVWGPLAERAASEVRKGTRVLVEGRLKVDSWADKATGAKRSAVKVVASSINRIKPWAGGEQGEWGAGDFAAQPSSSAAPGWGAQQPAAAQQQQQQWGAGGGGGGAPQQQTGEELWMDLFNNFGGWWDFRAAKQSGERKATYPDFKRKSDNAALWITGRGTPNWVENELPNLR